MNANVSLPHLRAARAQAKAELEGILAAPQAERRDLSADEVTRFEAKRSEIQSIDRQIEDAEEAERRAATAGAIHARYGQGGSPGGSGPRWHAGPDEVYRRGANVSYFQDLANARINPTPDVHERLNQHASQMDRAIAMGDIDRVARKWTGSEPNGIEYRVNPNRTDGQGGYFVPPAWLIEQYVDYARPSRAVADLCHPLALPPGTDVINLPRVATGTAVGVQTADAAAVTSQDMTDDFVTGPVRTIAGQQDAALQLLEQSPVGFDEVVFRDLQGDYNQKLDLQVLSGSGSAGQLKGILNVSGINAVTYTDATPTLPELWLPLMQSASKVAGGIYLPPDAIAMHTARWFWANSQLDTANRPLLGGEGPMNAMGSANPRAAEGAMGRMGGLPAVADANIPNNLGGGTNEDRMIIARFDELYLWESTPRVRVLQEVLSGTLQVRFQLYNYVAFIPDRRPKGISVISGTGLVAPAGF
ncbi:phage major capsid protein [Streptomyces mirabilis]